jgi:hypothetical protein
MSKTGWRDVIARFYAATNLVHDREQFKSRLRQLRHLWNFINQLRNASGLGRREDGSVLATDDWWSANTMVFNRNGSLMSSTNGNKQTGLSSIGFAGTFRLEEAQGWLA